MGYRAVFFDGAFGLLWILVCFMYLRVVGINLLPISLGVLTGLVYGGVLAWKYTRSIEKNGEFKTTRRILAFTLLAAVSVVLIAVYLFPISRLDTVIQFVSFLYAVLPAFFAARTIIYLSWERKNARRILFDGLLYVSRVYAVPELRGR